MTERSKIDVSLKMHVVPKLRALGFTGSFPHLRRIGHQYCDLLTFQFNCHGGSFTVEIARCKLTGIDEPSLGHIPVQKARAWDRNPIYRKRIGCSPTDDQWFEFAGKDAEAVAFSVWERLVDPSIWIDVSPEGNEAPFRKPN